MSGIDIGVTREDICRWELEEYRLYVHHTDRHIWWGNNVRIGVYVNIVAMIITVAIPPVLVAVIVGWAMILHGVRSIRAERVKAEHHLSEYLKWKGLKEVW